MHVYEDNYSFMWVVMPSSSTSLVSVDILWEMMTLNNFHEIRYLLYSFSYWLSAKTLHPTWEFLTAKLWDKQGKECFRERNVWMDVEKWWKELGSYMQ